MTSKFRDARYSILEFFFNISQACGSGGFLWRSPRLSRLIPLTKIIKIPGIFQILKKFAYILDYLSKAVGCQFMTQTDNQQMVAIVTPRRPLLYYPDWYEAPVASLFRSLLREGMKVVDVGASTGYYTLLAAKRVAEEGRVISFEPDPLRFRFLLKNIKINGWKNVEAYESVVSDVEYLYRRIVDPKVAVLDHVIEDIDLIKIDVEGGKLRVLRGMKKSLEKGAEIIIELHPVYLSSQGDKVEEVSDLLEQYGYRFYLIAEEGLVPTPCLLNDRRRHYYFSKQKG